MVRKSIALFIALLLCWTTAACGSSDGGQTVSSRNPAVVKQVNTQNAVNGRYPVQQATYDDSDGTYTLMLLDTPPGMDSIYRTDNLQMARLTDEQIAQGQKVSLEIEGDRAVLYLTEDFRIEYVHNVTEAKTDPQTGESQTVVVRRESNFWTPFAGALAGQAIGSLLFSPLYYVPPMYSPGPLRGYGGYGSTYGQAVDRYQTQHNAPPPAVKNRQTLRTTGSLRRSPSTTSTRRSSSSRASKSTGSGFGSSRLKNSGTFKSTRPKSNSSFGSSRRSPSRSFSGGGRRRR